MNNMEGAFAKNAVKGIASDNPLSAKRITRAMAAGRLLGNKSQKKQEPVRPIKVKSERVTPPKEEPQRTGPINVKSERVYPPEEKATGRAQRALPAPPAKKASKPRKPRDVRYTQPTLPGMRNTRQFKGKNGKP